MSAPLCSCDTYGSSGVKNTCSTAGELKRSINQLRAENGRLKADLAELSRLITDMAIPALDGLDEFSDVVAQLREAVK